MNFDVKFSENNQSFDVDMKETKVIDPSDQLAKVAKTGDYNDLINTPDCVTNAQLSSTLNGLTHNLKEYTDDKVEEFKDSICGDVPYTIQMGEGAKAQTQYCLAIGPEAEAGNPADPTGSEVGMSIGKRTKAKKKRDIATGYECVTDAENGFSGGAGSETTGKNAFSYGNAPKAKGVSSFSINTGNESIASDTFSGGYYSQAHRWASFVFGMFLRAYRQAQAVFGEYNAYSETALFIVGNGTAEKRSNAFVVNANGSATVQTSLKAPTLEATTVKVTGTPTNNTDAVNKNYADNRASNTLDSAKRYTDGLVGDIDKALDSIIAIQNSYIGGETV